MLHFKYTWLQIKLFERDIFQYRKRKNIFITIGISTYIRNKILS